MPKEEHNATNLEARFNRHLMQYETDKSTIFRLLEERKLHDEQVMELLRPISEVFQGSKFTADLIVKALKLLAMIGAAVAALLYLTGFFNK